MTSFEFVLCIGTDYTGPSAATELALNAEFAVNLGTPVRQCRLGLRQGSRTPLAIASRNSQQLLLDHGCALVATVLNRVDAAVVDDVRSGPSQRQPAHRSTCCPTCRCSLR